VRAFALVSLVCLASCQPASSDLNMPQPAANPLVVPPGFPKPTIPTNNPITTEKVLLGRYLFYEKMLSVDNSKSCGSCHAASASFADMSRGATSDGVHFARGSRNAPALMNVAYNKVFFWDGRAQSLEEQATKPITNPIELASDSNAVVAKLGATALYRQMFTNAFGDNTVTMDRIGKAIATFERTLLSGGSAYDRYMAGDKSALSTSAENGYKLFNSKEVNCVGCHKDQNFTDDSYHSTGLETFYEDEGREDVTQDPRDNGKFHTPSLRNIVLTGPYMHNGSMRTLDEVLQHYNEGGKHNSTQDSLIHELRLTTSQKNDLIAFLSSLTDSSFIHRADFRDPHN
jgi:cytochrome c peroxidase